MKAVSKVVFGWAACAVALAACGSAKHENQSNGTQQVHVQADAQSMDAEQLALAGEQLVAPHSFMLADKVFVMALSKDATNQRANFYHNFLKPLMLVQGGGTRITPLINQAKQTAEYKKSLSRLPNSPGRDFLMNGQADIKTADDAQNVAAKYTQAVFDLYDYLKTNQSLTLTLNLNPLMFSDKIKQNRDATCVINQNSENILDVVCDESEIMHTKVNIADMIALRQMVAGEALYSMMFTTYTVSGSEALLPEKDSVSGTQALDAMLAIPAFGKLRSDNQLGRLKALGADLSVAYKWVVKHQDRLCSAPDAYGVRRRGFLFDKGVCVDNINDTHNAANQIAELDKFEAGPAQVNLRNKNGDHLVTVANPFAAITSPIQDLKSLGISHDKCGNVITQDKTLGGALPGGTADFLLSKPGC